MNVSRSHPIKKGQGNVSFRIMISHLVIYSQASEKAMRTLQTQIVVTSGRGLLNEMYIILYKVCPVYIMTYIYIYMYLYVATFVIDIYDIYVDPCHRVSLNLIQQGY